MTDTGNTSQQREVKITRLFGAPRDVVFKAWMEPEKLKKWMSPNGFSVPNATIDPVVGGMWEFVMVEDASGQKFPNKSKFLEIVPQQKLVMSDSWEPLGVDAEDTIVTVTFNDVDGKTELTLHAIPMPDNEFTDGASQGWSQCFDKLEKLVVS